MSVEQEEEKVHVPCAIDDPWVSSGQYRRQRTWAGHRSHANPSASSADGATSLVSYSDYSSFNLFQIYQP
jgi:hypothetical protein